MSEIKIESGLPVPNRTRGRPGNGRADALRALGAANLGDSVFLADTKAGQAAAHACQIWGPGWYTSRKVEGGARIWKIAEPEPRR